MLFIKKLDYSGPAVLARSLLVMLIGSSTARAACIFALLLLGTLLLYSACCCLSLLLASLWLSPHISLLLSDLGSERLSTAVRSTRSTEASYYLRHLAASQLAHLTDCIFFLT